MAKKAKAQTPIEPQETWEEPTTEDGGWQTEVIEEVQAGQEDDLFGEDATPEMEALIDSENDEPIWSEEIDAALEQVLEERDALPDEEPEPVKPVKQARGKSSGGKTWHERVQAACDILGTDAGDTELAGAANEIYEALDMPIPAHSIEWVLKAGRIIAAGDENAGNRARSALQTALASDGVGV